MSKRQPAKRRAVKVRFCDSPNPPDKSKAFKMLITPEMAKELLKGNTDNRPPSRKDVLALGEELEHVGWNVNGETIKIGTDGRLYDGQTRLMTIIETGKPIWTWVIVDINPAKHLFESIDINRRRTLGHMLSIRGHTHYNALAATLSLVYSLDMDIPLEPGGFTSAIGTRLLEERPEIEDQHQWASEIGAKTVWNTSRVAGLYHLMARKDYELATKFWHQICTGVITTKDSPAIAVRNVLAANSNASNDKRLSVTTLVAIAIKGWNLVRKGRTCKYIRFNPAKEDFPDIR